MAAAARDRCSATRSCPPTGRTRTRTSWAGCRTRSTPATSGSSTATLEVAMDALRLPPAGRRGRRRSRAASGAASRCAGSCCSSPTCCCSTSPPTTSTRSRWPGWSGSCKEYKGTVVAVTHDRYFLDNVAGWILELDRGAGIPWEGNYSSWLEQKKNRLAQEEKEESTRQRTLRARAGVGAHGPARAPGQGQGAPHPLRGAAGRAAGGGQARRRRRDHDPARPAPGRPGHRGQGPAQGLRRQPAHGRRRASSCRAAASSASSARTARARRRSSA